MQSGNRKYAILLALIITCFTFFLSTKYWLPDDRTKQKANYDQLISIGDWSLRIGRAQYDESRKTLRCLVYQKTTQSKPNDYKISVYLGKSTLKKALPFTLTKIPNDPNYLYLQVSNAPRNFYYISVVATAQSSVNTTYTGTGNDYWGEESAAKTKPVVDSKTVKIDYRLTAKTDLSDSSLSLPFANSSAANQPGNAR